MQLPTGPLQPGCIQWIMFLLQCFSVKIIWLLGWAFPAYCQMGLEVSQQLVEKRDIARCPLGACPLFARLSGSPSAIPAAVWLCAAQALVEGGHFSSSRWVVYALTSRGDAEHLQSALVPCEEKHNIQGWGHFWGCSTNSRCLII